MSNKISIVYIGKKKMKRDTTRANSGTVWFGHGDVRLVEKEVARELLQHQDVWKVADSRTSVARELIQKTSQKIQKDTDDFDDAPVEDSEFRSAPGVRDLDADADFETLLKEDEEKEELTERSAKELNIPAHRLTKDGEIISLLKNLPEDAFSPTGKPRINAVRDLANNPNLSLKKISTLWKKVEEGK